MYFGADIDELLVGGAFRIDIVMRDSRENAGGVMRGEVRGGGVGKEQVW